MAKQTCDVPTCDNELPEGRGSHGGPTMCDACLSSRYYWRKQGPKALAARRARLQFFVERADYLAPYVGSLIRKARAKVSAAVERARTH